MQSNPFDPGYYRSADLATVGFKRVGANVSIAKNSTIIGLENIEIGSNVRIDGGVTLACNSGFLTIGDHVHIGANCYLACSGGIRLGNFAGLSQGVRVYSITDDYTGKALTNPTVPREYLNLMIKTVDLGEHVIVGSGSVILPGVTIGRGSSVGALAVVAQSLDQWGVYAGQPARRIKARSQDLLKFEQELLASGSAR